MPSMIFSSESVFKDVYDIVLPKAEDQAIWKFKTAKHQVHMGAS